jgi:hypothetical protein
MFSKINSLVLIPAGLAAVAFLLAVATLLLGPTAHAADGYLELNVIAG